MNNPIMNDFKREVARQGWKFFDSGVQCTGYYALPPKKCTDPIRFQFIFESNSVVNRVLVFRDVAESCIPSVAELILRINAAIILGSFEINYEQRDVHFKYALENSTFETADEGHRGMVADRFLRLPYEMIDATWAAFQSVIRKQKTPLEAFRQLIAS